MEALADIKIAQANRIFESIKPSLEGGDVAKTRLEPQELALIESVIFDAIGNRELSIKLYQKIPQSSLEKFLCILSYNTSRGEPTCGQAAKHVKIGLQTTGLESFLTQCKTYTQSKQKLKKLLEKLQTQQFSCFSREIRDISAILNEFTSASYQSQSQLQEFLDEKTKERFSRLGDAINELRKAAASQEEFLPSIHEPIVDDMPKIDETLATCTQSLQTICNMLKDFERSGLPSEDYHPPLHVSDLRTIFHYARLEESFAKFRLLGISFRDPKLLLLEKEVTEAHDLTHNLDSLIQLLPAYSSGDIFLDDEALISRFHGEEGPVFSQISLLRHPTSLKTLIKEGAARGPFAIQPYFTGSRTHAGMTILSGGVLSTFEITGRFISHPMTFEDACMNVAYRPDFLALLTPDGKRTLEQLWGELSQDEINRKLIELYTDTLRQYFALHEPQLRSLVNDCQKSTEAYFLDMTRSAPTALQHLVMSVSKRFFHWEKGGGLPWHLPPASLSFDENKMFCSEFVAKMFTQIQQTMKDYLNSQMPEDHLPVDFFQPVFPESVKKESIHPNRLEELLLPTFSRVKSPLALRLLLETSE